MNLFNWQEEPGWIGLFTRNQEPMALMNGSRVVKAEGDPGDSTPPGTPGVVLGSFIEQKSQRMFYFIEWADKPRWAVACEARKIKEASM